MNERSFVREVARRAGFAERRTEVLIFAVLQRLRDQFARDEATELATQLPASLRTLWLFFDRPDRDIWNEDAPEFLFSVARMVGLDSVGEAEQPILAVFSTLREALADSSGSRSFEHVMDQLPTDLKLLWLASSELG